MNNKKGQIIAFDVFFALMVFSVIVGVLVFFWYENLENKLHETEVGRMHLRASTVMDSLVSTPGQPNNWELSGDANRVGLAFDRRVLVKEKLLALVAMDYNEARQVMGLSAYDFYLFLEQDWQIVATVGTESTSARKEVVIERVVEFEGKPARLYLKVYR